MIDTQGNGDALKIGRACDEADFYGYEDTFKDGGLSCAAHQRLRQSIKTAILMGEHVRTLELKMDMALAEATDYMRVNPTYDLGITGAMKVAHVAVADVPGLGVEIDLIVCRSIRGGLCKCFF